MPPNRILIVDDEEQVRELLKKFFEGDGFEVLEAADGSTALEIAGRRSPDVVLTDLKMPPPDGLGVLEDIRRTRPEIPVLILTAYALPDNMNKARELGCDAFISKPVELKRLKYVVHEKLIERRWNQTHLSGWY
jgi:CheY-like chemotaxis protein